MTVGLSACAVGVAHDTEPGTRVTGAAVGGSGDRPSAGDAGVGGGSRSTLTTALSKGDCIGQLAGSGRADTVGVVDCSTPHAAQVGGSFTAAGQSWPGKDALQASALVKCPIAVAAALTSDASSLGFPVITPEEGEWDGGHHVVICLVRAKDGEPLTGSVIS